MNQSRRYALISLILVALTFAGCPSFDKAIKPIVTPPVPPPGYVPPVYVKGTRPEQQVDPSGLTLQVWRINADTYPDSIRLYARVFDRDQNLVTGLAPPYYRGTTDYHTIWSGLSEKVGTDGTPAPISDFTVREFSDQDGIPFEIALVLDYSGSMNSNIAALEDAAVAFIKLKRTQDRIAVVRFDKEAYLTSPATSSQSELLAKFTGKGLEGFGSYSAIYNAVRLGDEQIMNAPADHPRAIVVLTDGEDNASTVRAEEIYRLNSTGNIPIFTVAFGAVNRESLVALSEKTSGRFYQTYTPEELRSAFEDIYHSLRNYYLVSYKPPFLAGRHFVEIAMNPPRGTSRIAATGSYDAARGAKVEPPATTVALDTIYFEYRKTDIDSSFRPIVEHVVAEMQRNPRLRIEVRGHADARGAEELNQKLSEARAEEVRKALVAFGIDEGRIRTRGFGYSQPAATNDTEEGRKLNRRATFVVLAR